MLMPDVSYEYYYTVFNCSSEGVIPSESFPVFARRASDEVELRLCADPSEAQFDAVRMCLCAVAELIYLAAQTGGKKSESIDGYSVTFSDTAPLPVQINAVAIKYLAKHGLLYRGV